MTCWSLTSFAERGRLSNVRFRSVFRSGRCRFIIRKRLVMQMRKIRSGCAQRQSKYCFVLAKQILRWDI